MKCVICNKSIGKSDFKAYVVVYRGNQPSKLHACANCNETTFDDWIDSLPTDGDGRLIDPDSVPDVQKPVAP